MISIVRKRVTAVRIVFLLQIAFLILLTAGLYVVPLGASLWIIWPALLLFYLYFLIALLKPVRVNRNIPTYTSIKVLFLMFYYLIFFMQYQLYVLDLSDLYRNTFLTYTYVSQSNRAVLAATVGYVAFCLGLRMQGGSTRPSDTQRRGGEWQRYQRLSPVIFGLLAACTAIYEAAGWRSADEGRYTDASSGGAAADGIYLIIIMLCIISIARAVATLAQRRPFELSLWPSICLTSYWTIRILINGDRNSFFLLVIAAGGGISTFCFRFGRLFLFAGIAIALLLYNGIEGFRMSKDKSFDSFVEAIFSKGVEKDPNSSSFSITTTTLKATFDIVPETEGYGYGKYKVIGIAGVIPFIRGLVLGDVSGFTNTSALITNYVLGPNATWSVGSNIISDIYIDFGIIGIPVLMLLIGMLAGRIQRAAAQNVESTKIITIYLMMLALFAELPRYTFDFPVRMLAWTFMLFWIYDALMGKRKMGRRYVHVSSRAPRDRTSEYSNLN